MMTFPSIRLINCFVFLIILTVIISCTDKHKLIYEGYTHEIGSQVNKICNDIRATHFFVVDKHVVLKQKKTGNIFHINIPTRLPEGYYFCTRIQQTGSELE